MTEEKIIHSPFYQHKAENLPDGETKVMPGGLYVMDDEGGVVYQMFTNDSHGKPTGTFNLSGSQTAIISVNNLIKAKSYQCLKSTSEEDAPLTTLDPIIINHLVKTSREPLKLNENGFRVDIEGAYIHLYNVHGKNGQVPLIHTEKRPHHNDETKETSTAVHGMVYIEFNDDEVYLGHMKKTNMIISDPNGYFYFNPSCND